MNKEKNGDVMFGNILKTFGIIILWVFVSTLVSFLLLNDVTYEYIQEKQIGVCIFMFLICLLLLCFSIIIFSDTPSFNGCLIMFAFIIYMILLASFISYSLSGYKISFIVFIFSTFGFVIDIMMNEVLE